MSEATPLAELVAAADGGDAESAHRLALMHGCGLGAPHDWEAAFARLRQAASAMGTIWSSSPCMTRTGTSMALRSSVKSVSEKALMHS